MDNEIYLYREFWIKATETKLLDMTEDLIHDSRVQDFDKIEAESDISKSDAKNVIVWINWVLPILRPMFPVSDTTAQNRLRLMKLMRDRLEKKVNKT
jgi:hypothetical protein